MSKGKEIHGAGFLARDELARDEVERAEFDRDVFELDFRVLLVAAFFVPVFGPAFIACAATSFTAAAAMFWNCCVRDPHHCMGSTAGP